MNFTDKELNVIIAEFASLSEFLSEPEGKRRDARQIRNILKKAHTEKKRRENKPKKTHTPKISGKEWIARMENH